MYFRFVWSAIRGTFDNVVIPVRCGDSKYDSGNKTPGKHYVKSGLVQVPGSL